MPARKLRSLFVWHRWIGACASLFLLLLALTGLALNHADDLHLERRYVGWQPLLTLYRVPQPQSLTVYRVANHRLALVDDRLYLDRQLLSRAHRQLQGLIPWQGLLLAAVDDGLLLIDPDSGRHDPLGPESGLPTPIDGFGRNDAGQPVLLSANQRFVADAELLHWRRSDADDGWQPALPDRVAAAEADALRALYRGQSIDLQRLLLDLHSGRLFGLGPWLMDVVAVLTLLLAMSGPLLWWRQARKQRKRHL